MSNRPIRIPSRTERISNKGIYALLFGALMGIILGLWVATSFGTTLFLTSDTHFGPAVPDSIQAHQLAWMKGLPGTAWPFGGLVETPSLVLSLGDLMHEDDYPPNTFFTRFDSLTTYFQSTGSIALNQSAAHGLGYEIKACSGNHDPDSVRALILQREGILLHGFWLEGVYFQSLDYLPASSDLNSVTLILEALPAHTPVVLFHHQALSGGYINEWPPGRLMQYSEILQPVNVVAILHGHDHYSFPLSDWMGYPTLTPGSVRHSPGSPAPCVTCFPESFLVIKITKDELQVASWIFGHDIDQQFQHVWVGGAWDWTRTVPISRPRPGPKEKDMKQE